MPQKAARKRTQPKGTRPVNAPPRELRMPNLRDMNSYPGQEEGLDPYEAYDREGAKMGRAPVNSRPPTPPTPQPHPTPAPMKPGTTVQHRDDKGGYGMQVEIDEPDNPIFKYLVESFGKDFIKIRPKGK